MSLVLTTEEMRARLQIDLDLSNKFIHGLDTEFITTSTGTIPTLANLAKSLPFSNKVQQCTDFAIAAGLSATRAENLAATAVIGAAGPAGVAGPAGAAGAVGPAGSGSRTSPFLDLGTVNAGTATLNFALAQSQRLQIGGAVTIAASNWPAAADGLFVGVLELVNGGAYTLTWPAIRWVLADGTFTTSFSANTVTLQAVGTDFVTLWSRDGGATVYGRIIR
jgi:hypothetical protein